MVPNIHRVIKPVGSGNSCGNVFNKDEEAFDVIFIIVMSVYMLTLDTIQTSASAVCDVA